MCLDRNSSQRQGVYRKVGSEEPEGKTSAQSISEPEVAFAVVEPARKGRRRISRPITAGVFKAGMNGKMLK